jgi:hypothetical protein
MCIVSDAFTLKPFFGDELHVVSGVFTLKPFFVEKLHIVILGDALI